MTTTLGAVRHVETMGGAVDVEVVERPGAADLNVRHLDVLHLRRVGATNRKACCHTINEVACLGSSYIESASAS